MNTDQRRRAETLLRLCSRCLLVCSLGMYSILRLAALRWGQHQRACFGYACGPCWPAANGLHLPSLPCLSLRWHWHARGSIMAAPWSLVTHWVRAQAGCPRSLRALAASMRQSGVHHNIIPFPRVHSSSQHVNIFNLISSPSFSPSRASDTR